MKIISGSLKGRSIDNYNIEGTRPTMDRVKESVFAIIQAYLKESIFLDLFSGTGNIGIEAISNGAKTCYFVDNNKKCINIINSYIDKFNIKNKSIVLNKTYNKALEYFIKNNIKFDIIYLDPPYKTDYIKEILTIIVNNNLLNNNGIIIIENTNKNITNNNNLKIIKEKKYGNKYITILEKE